MERVVDTTTTTKAYKLSSRLQLQALRTLRCVIGSQGKGDKLPRASNSNSDGKNFVIKPSLPCFLWVQCSGHDNYQESHVNFQRQQADMSHNNL